MISKEKYCVSLQKKKTQENQDSRLQVKWHFLFDTLHLKGLGAGENSKYKTLFFFKNVCVLHKLKLPEDR